MIASEAGQSTAATKLDCFAASLLAMTIDMSVVAPNEP